MHYEIYDGIPLISKWFTLANHSSDTLCLDSYKSEILAVMEPENTAVFDKSFMTPNITVESDFAHANQQDLMDARDNQMYQRHVHWNKDPLYNTQVDWLMKTPCLLESYPEYGPAESVGKGGGFSRVTGSGSCFTIPGTVSADDANQENVSGCGSVDG